MATLKQVAKQAGLNPLRTEDGNYDASEALSALFQYILKAVGDGDEVRIADFGTFSCRVMKGRTNNAEGLRGGAISFGDVKILKFKQSLAAKRWLNSEEEKELLEPSKARRKGARRKAEESEEPEASEDIGGAPDEETREAIDQVIRDQVDKKKKKKGKKNKKKGKKNKVKEAKTVAAPEDVDHEEAAPEEADVDTNVADEYED